MIVAVISFGAITVLNGQLTSGGLIAVLLLSGRMMQPVQKGLGLWTRYQDFLLARVQLQDVFSIPRRAENSKTVELAHKDGAIELSGVSFGFDGQALFQDVDLSVAGGECILIAGGHGCGKTSLMKLMSGIYEANSGQVILNGQDIKHYPDFLRADHVGFVSTDPAIFRGTIRDNITAFGRIAEPDAREVANLFRVDQDVARLPSGFDTVLTGTETDSIPPGLKQRIAIVRALAARPRFIAFDNADKALDKQAYDQVFSVLAQLKGRATLILSSTDKNIQALADRTFFIQSGSVHEVLNTHKDENIFPYQELRL
jgi:ATP-binding cassette subfamily C protein LapB